jgi:hypothetical protein
MSNGSAAGDSNKIVSDLIAAMQRAQTQTRTDEDQAKFAKTRELLIALDDVCQKFNSNGSGLSTIEVYKTIAAFVALSLYAQCNQSKIMAAIGEASFIMELDHHLSELFK